MSRFSSIEFFSVSFSLNDFALVFFRVSLKCICDTLLAGINKIELLHFSHIFYRQYLRKAATRFHDGALSLNLKAFVDDDTHSLGLLIPMLTRLGSWVEFRLKFGSDAKCQLFSENSMDNITRIVTNMYPFNYFFLKFFATILILG